MLVLVAVPMGIIFLQIKLHAKHVNVIVKLVLDQNITIVYHVKLDTLKVEFV